MENSEVKLSKNDYVVMGLGAAASGFSAKQIINGKINNFANQTFQAFSKGGRELDSFVAKNSTAVEKMAQSSKGFFGKINKVIKSLGEKATIEEKIKSASKITDSYAASAAKKLGEGASKEDVKHLANYFHKKDIAKSIKSANFVKNSLKITGAAIFGAMGFIVLNEIITKLKTNSLAQKAKNEPDKNKNNQEEKRLTENTDKTPSKEIENKEEK